MRNRVLDGRVAVGARFAGLGAAVALSVTVVAAPTLALAVGVEEGAAVIGEQADVAVTDDASSAVLSVAAVAADEVPVEEATAANPAADADVTDSVADTTEPASKAEAGTSEVIAPAEADLVATSDAGEAPEPAVEPTTSQKSESLTEKTTTSNPEATEKPAIAVNSANNTSVAPTQAPTAEPEASTGIADKANVYRLFNPVNGEHLYTKDRREALIIASEQGWQWEGVGFTASSTTGQAVWRLYERTSGMHLWTTDANEKRVLLGRGGWNDEGTAWYGAGPYRLVRLYDPGTGQHLYTRDSHEVSVLTSERGWKLEAGAGTWATGSATDYVPQEAQWLDSSSWGIKDGRYWIQSDGSLAKSRYVSPSEGTGYSHSVYVSPSGAMVDRVMQVDDNHVMVGKKDGTLLTGNGFVWTAEFSEDHARHLYYIENGNRVRIGVFTQGGNQYFGLLDKGYELASGSVRLDGKWYWAGEDGKLAYLPTGKVGYQNPSWMYQVSANNATLPSYAQGRFAYLTASTIRPEYTRDQVVEAFIACAKGYLGTPYRWDYALAPGVGVDCSGLVMQCMQAVGIQSVYNSYDHMYDPWQDHDAANMRNDGKIQRISVSSARRGDLLFYTGHVAIYLGAGKIIESTNWQVAFDGVQISDAFARTPISAGRLFA
jgi:cell wall-associated NlpC family hydrolase